MPAQGDITGGPQFDTVGKPNTASGRAALAAEGRQEVAQQQAWNQWFSKLTPAQQHYYATNGNPGRSTEGGLSGFLDKWAPAAFIGLATGGVGAELGAAAGIGATAGSAATGAALQGGIAAIGGQSGGDILKAAAGGAISGATPGLLKGLGSSIAGATGSALLGKTVTGAIGGGLGGLISGKGTGTGAAAGAIGGAVGGVVGDATGSSTLGNLGGKLAGAEVGSYLNDKGSGSAPGTTQGYGNVLSGSPRATTGENSLTTPAQSTDLSQLPGNILGSLGSFATPTNLGYGAAAGLGLAEANQAKKDNQSYASTLTGLGQPYVDAGKQQLGQAQKGTLTPAQQAQVDNLKAQGKTLTDQSNPLISGGTDAIKAANAGTLPQWQQAQLDQQAAQQKAQLRQSLGANVDSSTLAQSDAQIDQQLSITKGNLIQQNLQSGMGELGQGTALEQQGQADIQKGYATATEAIQQSFQNAISLAAAGNGPIMDAVNLMIAGDSQISSALMGFMGNLAKAYASSGASGGGNGGGGSLGSAAGSAANPLKSLLSNLKGSSGSPDLGGAGGANSIIDAGAGNLLTDPLAGYDSNIYNPSNDWIGSQVPDLSNLPDFGDIG